MPSVAPSAAHRGRRLLQRLWEAIFRIVECEEMQLRERRAVEEYMPFPVVDSRYEHTPPHPTVRHPTPNVTVTGDGVGYA